jgi:hypothetical protein
MPTTRNRPQIPTFAEVARLVAPSDTQPWLPAHLEWWAAGVRHDQIADECRPTNVQTRDRLAAFATAARLIERELKAPAIRNLLSEARSVSRISISSWTLRDLASRADNVFSSPLLSSANGETKRGRSKPKVPDLFDARTLCAARILEMWPFFRKEIPGIGNRETAAAAQAYWLACGGKSNGYGDPLNGWHDYFKTVRDNGGSVGLKQLIWWRDLEQCKRRGRPPWYIGTYFPVPESEFKSPVQKV